MRGQGDAHDPARSPHVFPKTASSRCEHARYRVWFCTCGLHGWGAGALLAVPLPGGCQALTDACAVPRLTLTRIQGVWYSRLGFRAGLRQDGARGRTARHPRMQVAPGGSPPQGGVQEFWRDFTVWLSVGGFSEGDRHPWLPLGVNGSHKRCQAPFLACVPRGASAHEGWARAFNRTWREFRGENSARIQSVCFCTSALVPGRLLHRLQIV
jgi:hypothetical protein